MEKQTKILMSPLQSENMVRMSPHVLISSGGPVTIFTNQVYVIIVHTFCERNIKLLVSNENIEPSDEISDILQVQIQIFLAVKEVLKIHFHLGDPVAQNLGPRKPISGIAQNRHLCNALCLDIVAKFRFSEKATRI